MIKELDTIPTPEDSKSLSRLLKEALQLLSVGGVLDSESSPADTLLETMLDISLVLGNAAQQRRDFARENPEVFLPQGEIDELSNQLSVRRWPPRRFLDRNTAKAFYGIASFCSVLRRGGRPRKALIALRDLLCEDPPPTAEELQKQKLQQASEKAERVKTREAYAARRRRWREMKKE